MLSGNASAVATDVSVDGNRPSGVASPRRKEDLVVVTTPLTAVTPVKTAAVAVPVTTTTTAAVAAASVAAFAKGVVALSSGDEGSRPSSGDKRLPDVAETTSAQMKAPRADKQLRVGADNSETDSADEVGGSHSSNTGAPATTTTITTQQSNGGNAQVVSISLSRQRIFFFLVIK